MSKTIFFSHFRPKTILPAYLLLFALAGELSVLIINGQGSGYSRLNGNSGICHNGSPDKRISGGTDAIEGEFSSFVSIRVFIRDEPYIYCSGTLIHRNLVLTSASCVAKPKVVDRLDIAPGINAPHTWQSLNISPWKGSRICASPDFNPSGEDNWPEQDFALIKLAKPITLSRKINLACIPEKTANETMDLFTVGVGITENREYPPFAQVLETKKTSCPDSEDKGFGRVCFHAGNEEYLGHMCTGDGGAAIMSKLSKGRQCIYAVASFIDSEECTTNKRLIWYGADIASNKESLTKMIEACLNKSDIASISTTTTKPRTQLTTRRPGDKTIQEIIDEAMKKIKEEKGKEG